MAMKYLYLVFSILFFLFALVQLNDPDPLSWFGIYVAISIISFLAFRKKFYPILTFIIAVICICGAVYLFPISFQDWWLMEEQSKSLNMTMPGVEEARESMGLLLSALVLMVIFVKGRKLTKSNII